jgi:hypothetical protein
MIRFRTTSATEEDKYLELRLEDGESSWSKGEVALIARDLKTGVESHIFRFVDGKIFRIIDVHPELGFERDSEGKIEVEN